MEIISTGFSDVMEKNEIQDGGSKMAEFKKLMTSFSRHLTPQLIKNCRIHYALSKFGSTWGKFVKQKRKQDSQIAMRAELQQVSVII